MQRPGAWTIALGILVSVSACQSRAPTQPDPPTPVAAAPTPTPSPTPIAEGRLGCRLPPGAGDGVRCPYNGASFVDAVNSAIARTQLEHPELFDFTRCNSDLSCIVLDGPRYIQQMLQNLRHQELCAIFDGEEIAIKNSNEFSDQYHVLTSSGFSRWGIGSYRATCSPAWF
ncbi:MAG: hypothetical protein NDJ94_05070 [Vicinamibacteria bacterium]|nr:hypothetical protein [Vicinamibacteria bacterium]